MKKIQFPATLFAVAIILMATFSGCREEHDFSFTPLPVSGAEIHEAPDTIAIGDVLPLRGNTVPMNASNQAVTWTSTAPAVATVTDAGVVTGVELGTTAIVIRTTEGNYTDTLFLTVIPTPIPVTGVELNEDYVEILIGSTEALIATITPANATIQGVTWESSDTAVSTVSSTGVVTAVGVGTATITVTTVNGGFTATTEVTVTPILVTGVTIGGPSTVFEIAGETAQLTATVNPANATNRDVIWSSSNRNVATVSNTGLVTAVGDGEAMVMVVTVCGSFSAMRTVTIGGGPCISLITAANIATFVPDPDAQSVVAFLNGGVPSSYDITLMSPRLEAWRAAYVAAVPTFDRFSFIWPYSTPFTTGSPRSYALLLRYTGTTSVWPFIPNNPTSGSGSGSYPDEPILTAMTGTGDNPNSDATFNQLFRRDRISFSGQDQVPHSTTAPNFTINTGSGLDQTAVTAASRAIFAVGGTINTALPDAGENRNFIGFLNSPTGFTIIQCNCDPDMFWFRSKADPTDWFVVVRQ